MCRSIHTLYHLNPAATQEEIHAASMQFVRKITGYTKPSKTNELAFRRAVDEIEAITARLLTALETTAPARERSLRVNSRNHGAKAD
jgi:hypothetical protein